MFSWFFSFWKSDQHSKAERSDRDPGPADIRLIGSTGDGIKAAGTSHHQTALLRLAGKKGQFSKNERFRVLLIPEPDNPHDPNAVRVQFKELLLGYLPKKHAAEYLSQTSAAGYHNATSNVSADIIGGWKSERDEGSFGLRLLYDRPLRFAKAPSTADQSQPTDSLS